MYLKSISGTRFLLEGATRPLPPSPSSLFY